MGFTNDTITSESQMFAKWWRTLPLNWDTSAGLLALTSTFEGLIFLTGVTAGQVTRLGDAMTYMPGHEYCIHNASTQNAVVQNFGIVQLFVLRPNQRMYIILRDNTSQNGIWEINIVTDPNNSGIPRFVLPAGYDGVADTGRWLEFIANNPSNENPFVVAEKANIRALSLTARTASTGTVTIYKNGVALDTISLAAAKKNTKILLYSFTTLDEYSIKPTSGSIDRPQLFTSWEITG